ncbi:hypothetical protein [Cohnella mopanensis]|uniref:hypothetical protein n=1 Tax=Cohnella mopanensis TaxID=2911966 RepID=UPI001EF80C5E|nr:hypothetical protein [Cohnella mopanensis]
MKRSRYLILLLILCIVGLVFSSLKYFEIQNKNEDLQNSINRSFKYQLGNVLSSFSMEVNDYNYRSMLASVSNAASLSELTTYEKDNDSLDVCLYNLYFSLREDKSKDLTLSRIDELREIFFLLVQEPTSKEATDKLSQITNETFFKTGN